MTSNTNINFTQVLPVELSLEIFSYVNDAKDLVRSNEVCKEWNVLTSENVLWRFIATKLFPGLNIPSECENVKAFIGKSFALSENDILYKLDAFLKRVQLNQPATFTCELNSKKGQVFEVSLSYTKNKPMEPLQEKCIYLKKETQGYLREKNPEVLTQFKPNGDYYCKEGFRWNVSENEQNDSFKLKVKNSMGKRIEQLNLAVKKENLKSLGFIK